VAMIQFAVAPDSVDGNLFWQVPLQLAVGAAVGAVVGAIGRRVITQVPLSTVGLYPAFTLALAFLSFGLTSHLQGSGLLSVYVTGLILGSGFLPYRAGLHRIHNALGWLSQVGLFLMLGLLVFPSRLLPIAGVGLSVGLFLALVARPLAVTACLLPLGYSQREIAYIGWIGLRGAVPVILGVFPMLAGVPGAERIFNIVFFVVVLSTLLPGATIRLVTRWLKQATLESPRPSAVLELNSAYPFHSEIASFFIEAEAAVCGARLSEIALPADAAVMLVVRGRQLLPARGNTMLMSNDHVYAFFRPADRRYIELLFGLAERP